MSFGIAEIPVSELQQQNKIKRYLIEIIRMQCGKINW